MIVQKALYERWNKPAFKQIEFSDRNRSPRISLISRTAVHRCDLSDIEMPQMDGLTLCKKVKAIPVLNKIPFYLLLLDGQ